MDLLIDPAKLYRSEKLLQEKKLQDNKINIINTILYDWKRNTSIKNKQLTENISYSIESSLKKNGDSILILKYFNSYHQIKGFSNDKSFVKFWLVKILD